MSDNTPDSGSRRTFRIAPLVGAVPMTPRVAKPEKVHRHPPGPSRRRTTPTRPIPSRTPAAAASPFSGSPRTA